MILNNQMNVCGAAPPYRVKRDWTLKSATLDLKAGALNYQIPSPSLPICKTEEYLCHKSGCHETQRDNV